MMASIEITSAYCAETDSKNRSQVSNGSFDVGAFSDRVNESYAFFPLASLPAGAIVTSGTLKLRQYQGDYWNKEVTMRAAACTNYIAPGSVTWDNKPSVSGSVFADYPNFYGNVNADRAWTIDANLNNFRLNGYLIIKVWIPDTSAGANNAKGFRPSTYSISDYRPKITLSYYEIPLKSAIVQGAVSKQVISMMIAPAAGPVSKKVVGMKVAPAAGPINKTVF
jgi:hypothetical protein